MAGEFDVPAPAPLELPAAAALQPQVWQRPVPLVLGVVTLLVIAGVVGWSLQPETLPRPLTRFAITPAGPDWLGISEQSGDITISPDGTHIVNRGGPAGLVIRALDQLEATRQAELGGVLAPFMSPDGASVGFLSPGNSLQQVSVFGGPPVTICTLPSGFIGLGASWGADDTIIFGTTVPSGLWRVPAGGGEPNELTTPNAEFGEVNHNWPEILPGGRAVLFTIIQAAPIENAQIAVLNLDTGTQTVLVPGGSSPRYSPTGHIVYAVNGTLRAVGFDLDRLEVTTSPRPVLDGVITKSSGAANFSFSHDGTLVYVPGTGVGSGSGQRTLVWVDREGREEPLSLPPGGYIFPRVSPDGARVAVGMASPEGNNVWISDVARGTLSILTPDPTTDQFPLWTPDGEKVVFWSDTQPPGLFWRAADASGEGELLMEREDVTTLLPHAWSPDGNELIFDYLAPGTGFDVGVLSMVGERSWKPLLNSAAGERSPALSPDGAWIAYSSNETGQEEVYVERFPELGSREPISTGGGRAPVWSPDGRELFYRTLDGDRMMVVPVDTDPMLTLGTATVVFEETYFQRGSRRYDLAPDGRFLMIKELGGATALPQIVVVQNWFEELKRLVPVD